MLSSTYRFYVSGVSVSNTQKCVSFLLDRTGMISATMLQRGVDARGCVTFAIPVFTASEVKVDKCIVVDAEIMYSGTYDKGVLATLSRCTKVIENYLEGFVRGPLHRVPAPGSITYSLVKHSDQLLLDISAFKDDVDVLIDMTHWSQEDQAASADDLQAADHAEHIRVGALLQLLPVAALPS